MTMKYWMMIKGQSMHINLTIKIKMTAATMTQLEQLVQVQYAITDVVVMVREVADHQVILIAVDKVNKALLLFCCRCCCCRCFCCCCCRSLFFVVFVADHQVILIAVNKIIVVSSRVLPLL